LIVARHGRIPPCRLAGTDLGDWIVIRLDATLVIAHSDKEQTAKTFEKTFGYHPLTAWCDNTGELLVVLLRPGNAGANTAADHLTVLKAALEQIPLEHRPCPHCCLVGDAGEGAACRPPLLDQRIDAAVRRMEAHSAMSTSSWRTDTSGASSPPPWSATPQPSKLEACRSWASTNTSCRQPTGSCVTSRRSASSPTCT
jgi:Transposase DDE domain group 1